MSDVNEPKKETVRITLPPRPAARSENSAARRDTVRIQLPPRPGTGVPNGDAHPVREVAKAPPPPAPIPRPAALPGLGQPPKAPPPVRELATPLEDSPALSAPSAMPPNLKPPPPPIFSAPRPPAPSFKPRQATAPIWPGPKKETARIAVMPERSSAAPTVKMSKTQPLIPAPATNGDDVPIFVEPPPLPASAAFDFIPMPLCWGILAGSALVFLIQLWNYFS